MTTLTTEEIISMLSEIAKDPEAGADRFRALRMLSSANASTVTLPEPLDGKEVTERLTRMIQCAGPSIAQVAFRRAFPTKKKTIDDTPKIFAGDVPQELLDQVKPITSLKLLHRAFPEIKNKGVPKGYPVGRGIAAQREWIQRAAVKLLIDRENAERRGPEQAKGIDEHLRSQPTEDAVGTPSAQIPESTNGSDQVAGA